MSPRRRKFAMLLSVLCCALAALYAIASPGHRGRPTGSGSTRSIKQSPQRANQATERNEHLFGNRGVITGRVIFENGKPAAGFRVMARIVLGGTGAWGEGEAVTDEEGRYVLGGLAMNEFRVTVENGGKPFVVPPPRRIKLTENANRVDDIDFTLRIGPRVTVRVRDAQTGEPIRGITINSEGMATVATDARGEAYFRASRLDFNLHLSEEDMRAKNTVPAPGYGYFHAVRLDTVRPVVWEVKVYQNANSPNTALLTGEVIDPDGQPASSANVRMVRDSMETVTRTDAHGRFSFETYRMTTHESQSRGIILRVEKDDLSAVTFPTAQETWDGVVIHLQKTRRPSIYGTVVAPDGKAQEGVPITFWENYPDSSAQFSLQPKNGGSTDSAGCFIIRDLSAEARYHLSFGGRGLRGDFGTVMYPVVKTTKDYMRLSAGEHRDIGRIIVPSADAVVAGRITKADGKSPAGNFMVVVRGKHTNISVPSDSDGTGNFRAECVVREPLTISVYMSSDGTNFFRTGLDSPDVVYSGPVNAGNTQVKIILKPTKSKTGTSK